MRVEDAIRRLNGYLQRRGSVDGSGGWTEQWLLDILTDANLDMYHRIVNYGPEIFHRTSRFTYTKNQAGIHLPDMLGSRPMALWYVGTLTKDEGVGPNNVPTPVQMVRRPDIDSGGSSGVTSTTALGGSFLAANTAFNLGGGSGFGAYKGFLLGDEFSLRDIPEDDTYIYMRWTPAELPALIDKDDEILDGQLAQFHPAVVLKAAISAKSAKGEDISQLDRMYQEMVGPYDSTLKMGARSRQRQQPPQREPMRWEY